MMDFNNNNKFNEYLHDFEEEEQSLLKRLGVKEVSGSYFFKILIE
jgi:hypothetical protein